MFFFKLKNKKKKKERNHYHTQTQNRSDNGVKFIHSFKIKTESSIQSVTWILSWNKASFPYKALKSSATWKLVLLVCFSLPFFFARILWSHFSIILFSGHSVSILVSHKKSKDCCSKYLSSVFMQSTHSLLFIYCLSAL